MLKSITRQAQFLPVYGRSVSLQAKLPKSPQLVPQTSKLFLKVHNRPTPKTDNFKDNQKRSNNPPPWNSLQKLAYIWKYIPVSSDYLPVFLARGVWGGNQLPGIYPVHWIKKLAEKECQGQN